ncbi:MAG: hypothetical protein KDE35_15665 [Geminicoccaceae bacterium]|nr:hypothetical protein [Geminicoccaceae bacterium]
MTRTTTVAALVRTVRAAIDLQWLAAAGDARAAAALAAWQRRAEPPAPPSNGAARRERDQALRAMRDSHFAGLPARAAATAIVETVRRYEAGRWRRDRDRSLVPPELVGSVEAAAWRVLRSGAGVPTAEHIRKHIL